MSLDVYTLKNQPKFVKPIYILGSFESFHIGHALLLAKAQKIKAQNNGDIVLVIFKDIEKMHKSDGLIFSDYENRLQEIANLNIKNCISLIYSEISSFEPDKFINELTKNQEDFTIVCGDDFHYGFKATGDVKTLKKQLNDKAVIVPAMKLQNGQKVSTNLLKEFVEFGDINLINKILLYSYSFSAELNISEDKIKVIKNPRLLPLKQGLYLANIEINKFTYYAILNVHFDTSYEMEFIDFEVNEAKNLKVRFKVLESIRTYQENEEENIKDEDRKFAKKYFLQLLKK